ncbi:MAG: hypothetical protein AUK48_01755 [Oscillatoriales cyanobacterium CG2_30_44_21]|nr:MAG: hypothetical protein AUK48_01755 [Oscillatoriales cyanobacterium CG2_30_44_21]
MQVSKKNDTFPISEAWFIISLFIFVSVILLTVGAIGSKLLSIIFPLGAFIVAWYLYFRYPFLYIGFVWWLMFLTPFVRRLADFRTGSFTDSNPLLIAPTLAILVAAHTMYFNLSKSREQGTIPFVLAMASVMYGYCVGLLNPSSTPLKATLACLGWLTPILFGYHLYVNWRRYPEYSQVIKKIFLWGSLIVGIYGVYQYVVAPEWDKLWLVGSKMDGSAGRPVAYGMRVWSTLNSPGPFADMMATSLLVLFSSRSPLTIPSAVAGGLSFLFSAVRTGWLGWVGGLIFYLFSLKSKQQMRLISTLLFLFVLIIPLTTIEPFSTNITTRLNTLGDLENDNSAQVRRMIYEGFFNYGIYNFIGDGLGVNGTVDAGVLSFILDLGWIGTLPYLGSLLLGGTILFINLKKYSDLFINISCAVLVKSLAFFLAARATAGIHGVLIWTFLSMGLAGQRYLSYQQSVSNDVAGILESDFGKDQVATSLPPEK